MTTRTVLGVGLATARGLLLSIYAVPHGSGRLLGCQDDRCVRDRPGRLTKSAKRQDRPRSDDGVRTPQSLAGSSVGGGRVSFCGGHRAIVLETLALRQQLAVLTGQPQPLRPRVFRAADGK